MTGLTKEMHTHLKMRFKISNLNMGCTPPPHPGCRVVAVQSKGNPDRSDQILIDQSHTECNPRQIFNRLLPAALRFLSFFSFSLVLTPPHPPRVRRCRLGSQLLLADATPRPARAGAGGKPVYKNTPVSSQHSPSTALELGHSQQPTD